MLVLLTVLRVAVLLVIAAASVVKYVSTRDVGFLILAVALAIWPLALALLNPVIVSALTSGAMQRGGQMLGLSVGEIVALWSSVLNVVGDLLGLAGVVVLYSGAGRRNAA
ncbi:MAG: hypothetical protein GX649_02575 [Chloroflexi bacterium]|nr:hypothetical protein [Chloroflexota bacterium]